jgi:hypothetical protein
MRSKKKNNPADIIRAVLLKSGQEFGLWIAPCEVLNDMEEGRE